MFAKENKREGGKRRGRDRHLARTPRLSGIMIPVHPHRLLPRFIGILCYSQVPSLLIRALFSLIKLFW